MDMTGIGVKRQGDITTWYNFWNPLLQGCTNNFSGLVYLGSQGVKVEIDPPFTSMTKAKQGCNSSASSHEHLLRMLHPLFNCLDCEAVGYMSIHVTYISIIYTLYNRFMCIHVSLLNIQKGFTYGLSIMMPYHAAQLRCCHAIGKAAPPVWDWRPSALQTLA